MSNFLRHKKQNEKWNNILNILDKKFSGNTDHLHDAVSYYKTQSAYIRKIRRSSTILSSISVVKEDSSKNKITVIDFDKTEMSLIYPFDDIALFQNGEESEERRHVKKIRQSKREDRNCCTSEINDLLSFAKNTFQLSTDFVDIDNQTMHFHTICTDEDQKFRQFICLVGQEIDGSLVAEETRNFRNNFSSLVNLYNRLGFRRIYFKCDCDKYLASYDSKKSINNYICKHLLQALSVFPYYIVNIER